MNQANSSNFWKIISSFTNNEYFRNLVLKIENRELKVIFLQNSCDITSFNKYFIKQITSENLTCLDKVFPGTFYFLNEISEDKISSFIYKGCIILYINEETIYNVFLPKIPERSIDPSLVDPNNMYGSKDALLEGIDKNASLIERRIKNKSLKIEKLQVGVRTNTEINIIHLGDVANKRNVSLIKEKINSLNVDGIKSISDIANLFNKKSLFPLVGTTSSLDVINESLLNGRIIILIDQIPVALIMPVTITFFSSLKEEDSSPFFYSIKIRFLSVLLFFFSVFFLGLYVAIINYHPESLSLIVLSEIKMTIRGTTIPLYAEILYILLTFEFLRMASIRTPSNNLQNVLVIVGGILIGQNSVNSGFIGAFNLVITSICYLSTFGITNDQHLITSLSYLRLFILFFSLVLGFFGFIISSILCLIYVYNLCSLSTPYLAPVSPPILNELKNVFIPRFLIKRNLRPLSVEPIDKTN